MTKILAIPYVQRVNLRMCRCRYFHLLCSRCLCRSEVERSGSSSGEGGVAVAEARKRKNALRQVAVREDRQVAVLGLLHSLLESAPQLVLQLYTMAQRTEADSLTIGKQAFGNLL